MKTLFVLPASILFAVTAFSQPIDAGSTKSVDMTAERNRIQGERAHMEARVAQEEAACYARFAVTDCLREVRVRRREALTDLRRQDIVLKEIERKRKTREQMERISEKSSAQRFEEEAARRLDAR